MQTTTYFGPTGIPYSAIEVAPCAGGILVTVAPYTRFAVTPHPSGVEGMPPLILADGDTLRLPPEKVRELVDARKILDPVTGALKPEPPSLPPRLGISNLGPQLADTQRYLREEAAREERLAREQRERDRQLAGQGARWSNPTGTFDPLGPIEGVDY